MTACIAPLVLLPMVGAPMETTVVIERRESVAPQTLEWPLEVPPFSVEHQVRLSLEARIDWPELVGSNPWIQVAVNDNLVGREDLLLDFSENSKIRSGCGLRQKLRQHRIHVAGLDGLFTHQPQSRFFMGAAVFS